MSELSAETETYPLLTEAQVNRLKSIVTAPSVSPKLL
jgi:hypothetical protein